MGDSESFGNQVLKKLLYVYKQKLIETNLAKFEGNFHGLSKMLTIVILQSPV